MIQIKVPDAGDPYFNNIAGGGISTCITGSGGGVPGLNVLPNCVGGAVGCFNKAAAGDNKPAFKYLNYPPNAENLIEYAQKEGLTVSQTPAVGSLVVWQKGVTLNSSDGAGHTAFVNAVDEDGTIHTSESEWSGRAWVNSEYKPPYVYGSAYKFLGFIHQPQKKPAVLKEGCHGAEVELMQARLHALGYMRKNEIDGDFGKITKGAVLCFQLEHGLDPDGVCGPATQAALAK